MTDDNTNQGGANPDSQPGSAARPTTADNAGTDGVGGTNKPSTSTAAPPHASPGGVPAPAERTSIHSQPGGTTVAGVAQKAADQQTLDALNALKNAGFNLGALIQQILAVAAGLPFGVGGEIKVKIPSEELQQNATFLGHAWVITEQEKNGNVILDIQPASAEPVAQTA